MTKPRKGLTALESFSGQDLSRASTAEVNDVILDPGFIKDGEDRGKQLENCSVVLLAQKIIMRRNKDTSCA